MLFLLRTHVFVFCLLLVTFTVQASLKESEGYVQVVDGELYYKEFGQGFPIIIVHGGPGLDQTYLQPQMVQLANNYRVIFYDQRGSGKSLKTKIDEKSINSKQFVEDLEVLRRSLGLNKFILVGHSWGGLLAMQYAIAHQEYLAAMILICPSPADSNGQKAFVEEFAVKTKPILEEIKPIFSYDDFKKLNAIQIAELYRKLFSVYFYDSNKVKELNLTFSLASAQSGFRVREEMTKTSWLQPNFTLFPDLKKLTVPTLILHGKQDIVPVWTAQEIKNSVADAEIALIDRCGHFPYIEQPSPFFSQMFHFLKKVGSHELEN